MSNLSAHFEREGKFAKRSNAERSSICQPDFIQLRYWNLRYIELFTSYKNRDQGRRSFLGKEAKPLGLDNHRQDSV